MKSNEIYKTLSAVDVSDKIRQKNGINYLSWADAWGELKKRYPESFYSVYEDEHGKFYHTDGRTCWVKVSVTVVDGDYCQEMVEYYPIMNYKNMSIPAETVTSVDANRAIQRAITKAIARHGLYLYGYAGEEYPEEVKEQKKAEEAAQAKAEEEKKQKLEAVKADMLKADAEIKRVFKNVTPEDKEKYTSFIKTTCGQLNYRLCTDAEQLKTLYEYFKSIQ